MRKNTNHWSKTEKREEVLKKISKGWKNLEKCPNKKNGKNITCPICGKVFYRRKSLILAGKAKYCSQKCNGIAKKSIPEEKHASWKGDKVGYFGIHKWVQKHKGKPGKCKICGKMKNNQWANIDHKYRRNLKDYISLCPSCHKKYDLKMLK